MSPLTLSWLQPLPVSSCSYPGPPWYCWVLRIIHSCASLNPIIVTFISCLLQFCYLLLCNRKLLNLVLKITHIIYFIGSMGQKFGNGLAECFWLRISHEVAVKLLTGAIVKWRRDWGWKLCFQDGSLTWLLAGCPLIGPLGFPRMNDAFYYWVLEVIHC